MYSFSSAEDTAQKRALANLEWPPQWLVLLFIILAVLSACGGTMLLFSF